jgi:CubicO group peptidase (beta-lactamase class C family)
MNPGGTSLPLSLKSFNYNVTESKFGFYYSSSVSNLLAREFRKLFKSDDEYLNFPNKYLFGPIGASSFILDTDPSGTFVASSFGYASPRDWAKLGDIVRRRGVASDGSRVIPEQFIDFMLTARSFSGGHYGGSIWLNPARVGVGEYNFLGPDDKDKRRFRWMTRAVPQDAAMMSGFNGQYVMVIPSLNCVIVRLGFTPGVWEAGIGDEDDSQVPFNNYHFFRTLSDHCARLNENH